MTPESNTIHQCTNCGNMHDFWGSALCPECISAKGLATVKRTEIKPWGIIRWLIEWVLLPAVLVWVGWAWGSSATNNNIDSYLMHCINEHLV